MLTFSECALQHVAGIAAFQAHNFLEIPAMRVASCHTFSMRVVRLQVRQRGVHVILIHHG